MESTDSGVIAAAHATAPDPVAAVNVTHKGSSLEVSWNAPARASHYDVTYSGGGVNARAAWNRAGTSITIRCDSREGYENQNCVSGTNSYTVGVRARNAVGTSAWVNSAQAILPARAGGRSACRPQGHHPGGELGRTGRGHPLRRDLHQHQ